VTILNLSVFNKRELSFNSERRTPALVIETNISYDGNGNLHDHQSRVIEIDTWKEYCDLYTYYNGDYVGDKYMSYGLLSGCVLPKNAEISELEYNEFHLKCKLKLYNGNIQYKLAYILEREFNL
jgi:hypothetical protein